MGCSISRQELRGRGTDPGLLSLKHILDDGSRTGRALLAQDNQSLSAKFLVKESLVSNHNYSCNNNNSNNSNNNSVSLEKKDFVLGGTNDMLLHEKEVLKDPKLLTTTKPPMLPGKTDNMLRVEALVRQPKTKNQNHDEDLEETGAVIPKFDGPLWIASPSFRDYCTNVVPDAADSDDDNNVNIPKGNHNINNNSGNNKSKMEDLTKDIEIANDDNSNRCDDSSSGRRSVKRRRKLKKVLTMHRPSAVRNLFNVATCYNPLTPSAHNAPRNSHTKSV